MLPLLRLSAPTESTLFLENVRTMRRSFPLLFKNSFVLRENLVQIRNGTIYRQHPAVGETHSRSSTPNPPLFSNISFELPAGEDQQAHQHWAILGNSGATTLLEILRGLHICLPTNARTFPYLSSDTIAEKDPRLRIPSRAIQYVGFNGGKSQGPGSGVRGAYLSARYESRREETDWSVLQYLKGETELNPSEDLEGKDSKDGALLAKVIRDLRLEKLATMPVSNLSNGQTRRARIARALLGRPELLLLDEPFMGLDPPTLVTLSPILRDLAYNASPRLLLALRPQDPIPDWITHLIVLGTNHTISLMGPKAEVLFRLYRWTDNSGPDSTTLNMARRMAREMSTAYGPPLQELGHSLTSKGIIPYKTYQAAKEREDFKMFKSDGTMNADILGPSSLARFKRALSVPQDKVTIPDLLDMTALVPLDYGTDRKGKRARHAVGAESAKKGKVPREQASSPAQGGAEQFVNDAESPSSRQLGEPLIELSSVVVKYGEKTVLGYPPPQPGFSQPGLNLNIRQGTRLALLGPNGSGKTTLLSLLTSDHPHSYSLPIKFFGRSRLPSLGKAGLSLFEIQSRIGHSSPEIHAFFPKNLSIRQTLESAWAETFSARPKLTHTADETVDVFLKWWESELKQDVSHQTSSFTEKESERRVRDYMPDGQSQRLARRRAIWRAMEQSIPSPIFPDHPWFPYLSSDPERGPHPTQPCNIDWAETTTFRDLPFGTQRLLLLLRALVKKPDIVVLDEAFSGLSPDARDKAMRWLRYGQTRYPKRITRRHTEEKTITILPPKWTLVENQRHIVEAAFAKLDVSEEEVMEKYGQRRTPPELNDMRNVRSDEELHALLQGFYPSNTYRFTGLEDRQALVVVSHVKEEVPSLVDEWVRLPGEEEVLEQGRGVEMGECPNGEINTVQGWNRVWGLV